MKMNISNMVRATENSKRRVRTILDLAFKYTKDPDKKERIKKHECVHCFYDSRIGGCAMTNSKCMSCDDEELYSSTNTDSLCLKCAKEHKLCKHCGGDLELRSSRRKWPESKI